MFKKTTSFWTEVNLKRQIFLNSHYEIERDVLLPGVLHWPNLTSPNSPFFRVAEVSVRRLQLWESFFFRDDESLAPPGAAATCKTLELQVKVSSGMSFFFDVSWSGPTAGVSVGVFGGPTVSVSGSLPKYSHPVSTQSCRLLDQVKADSCFFSGEAIVDFKAAKFDRFNLSSIVFFCIKENCVSRVRRTGGADRVPSTHAGDNR